MNGYLLDTNIVTAHLKQQPGVKQRIWEAELAGHPVRLNAVSYYETKRGLLAIRAHRQLAAFERRALGIVCAGLGRPEVIVLEAPLRGLEAEAADYVARLCSQAAKHSRLIVSAGFPTTPSPERALLDACQELCVLSGGALVAQGSPNQILAPGSRYLLRVSGAKSAAFAAALRDAGCRLSERDGSGRYLIDLPESAGSETVLDAALALGVVVLELQPCGYLEASQPLPASH